MKYCMTTCSGCGQRFDRARGYSGSVINPYCTTKECTAKFLRNSVAMAAAPRNLLSHFEMANGFDNELWAGQQRRLEA